MVNLKPFQTQLVLSFFFFTSPGLSVAQKVSEIPLVKATTLQQWMVELSNWGRWGDNDELGTLNLITPEKRVQAAALVKEGRTISLAFDLSKESGINNGDPLIHQLGTSGQWAGDTYTINYHGYAHSHIDALCHIANQGKLYNGYAQEGRKANGAEKLGIENMGKGIFTRGVLMDLPWLKGVPYLEPGTAIMTEDIEAWERKTGIEIGSGDVLLIRTGRWECEKQNGPWKYSEKAAGLHASVAKWLKVRDVAVLGSDGASDVLPSGVEGQTHPVHQLVLIALGMPILDNLNLEELAEEGAKSNKWVFLFVGSPLRIEGGTGSPLNPIAIF